MSDVEQKREHFRISYPIGHSGKILIRKAEYPIIDVSQRGIRFSINGKSVEDEWDVELPIKAQVSFLFGEKVEVSGKVLRTSEVNVILYLDEGIPLKHMYDEHRYLIKNFSIDD